MPESKKTKIKAKTSQSNSHPINNSIISKFHTNAKENKSQKSHLREEHSSACKNYPLKANLVSELKSKRLVKTN